MALRVLLADESTTIKKVMQLALQDFAVEVKAVHAGIDVLEVARVFQPDIVFADVLLQKKSGYEVSGDLKRDPHLSVIPVVLMWSSFMELDERAAQESGANARLEKPFEVEGLRQMILELVPKTRSQRLAHFLQFSPSVSEPLRKEEAARKVSQPPGVSSTSAAQFDAVADLVTTFAASARARESIAQLTRSTQPPPSKPTQPPMPPGPGPNMAQSTPNAAVQSAARNAAKMASSMGSSLGSSTPSSASGSSAAAAAARSRTASQAPRESAKTPPPPPPRQQVQAPSQSQHAPTRSASAWNMDSFEDIQEFVSQRDVGDEVDDEVARRNDDDDFSASTTVSLADLEDESSDSDEVFSEFKLANLTKTKSGRIEARETQGSGNEKTSHGSTQGSPQGSTQGSPQGSTRSSPQSVTPGLDDRDPWSHQDLSRFKIDLEPVSVEDEELGINFDVDEGELNASDYVVSRGRHFEAHDQTHEIGESDAVSPENDDSLFELATSENETEGDYGPSSSSLGHLELHIENSTSGEESFELSEDLAQGANSGEQMPKRLRLDESIRSIDGAPQLSADRLEQIIRAQSRDIIETVVRRIVPEIATEIIRKELQRLFDESSS